MRQKLNHLGGNYKLVTLWLRRVEAQKCFSTGIELPGICCYFEEPVILLPYGLSIIIIARNLRIGSYVIIYQHVTITESDSSKTTNIEDNVMIGAGDKIGTSAVVVKDVLPGEICVGASGHIVLKDKELI